MARDLPQLREKIDQIDAAIVALLAQRMEVCKEVAEVKAGSSTAVIQPQRVREVLTTRRQWAINSGVDADFAEQLFRIVLPRSCATSMRCVSESTMRNNCSAKSASTPLLIAHWRRVVSTSRTRCG